MRQPAQNADRVRWGRGGEVFLDQGPYFLHVMRTANVTDQFYNIAQLGAGFLENPLQVGYDQLALRLEVVRPENLPLGIAGDLAGAKDELACTLHHDRV